MPEPAANDVDLDAGFEEMDGRRVPEHVRGHGTTTRGHERSAPTPDEFVNAIARERRAASGREDGAGGGVPLRRLPGTSGVEQQSQQPRGFRPQRTGTPLVAFAVQLHARRGGENEMFG